MVNKRAISLLELGVGSGRRLSTLRHRKGRAVIGVDNNRRKAFHLRERKRVRSVVEGTKLFFGKKGEAENFLRKLIERGKKVRVVNAEYFFANLDKQLPFPEAHWTNIGIANKETKKILELVKRVLVPNGRVRLEVCKFDSPRWKKVLENCGFFVTSVTKVPDDKIASWWGKHYQRENRKYKHDDFEPTQIIARLK